MLMKAKGSDHTNKTKSLRCSKLYSGKVIMRILSCGHSAEAVVHLTAYVRVYGYE